MRDMAEDDLMRHVSFVFQDIFLFKQSILDTIITFWRLPRFL